MVRHFFLCTDTSYVRKSGKKWFFEVMAGPKSCIASHEKQRSSQRKCREHLSNLPSHRDNATHQGISISQPCYEDDCVEWSLHCSWELGKGILLTLIRIYFRICGVQRTPKALWSGTKQRVPIITVGETIKGVLTGNVWIKGFWGPCRLRISGWGLRKGSTISAIPHFTLKE